MKQLSAKRGGRPDRSDATPRGKALSPPVSGAEACVVAFLLLVAGAFRLGAPGRIAVEHFDEGVYASNLWFGAEAGYQYPNRPLYAPPLTPFLIEWCLIRFGPHGAAPVAPSLLAGWATVGLVWWAARQAFGPAAGVAATAWGALSGVHLLYSRAALTDALLCFWLLLSVWLTAGALRYNRFGLAAGAGVAAGLAWWTKYNGWLAVGIAVGGGVCWVLAERRSWQDAKRVALLTGVLAVVAASVWSPVLIGLQNFPGGYGAVVANHAKYVVGLDGWFASAKAQLAALRTLEGGWSSLGLAVAVLAAGLVREDRISRNSAPPLDSPSNQAAPVRWAWLAFGATLGFAVSALVGATAVAAILAFAGLVRCAWRVLARRTTNASAPDERGPELWLLGVWLVGLTFATPLYHPYPRLTLPWIVASWIGAGLAVREWAGALHGARAVRRKAGSTGIVTGAAAVFLVTGASLLINAPSRLAGAAWQSRVGLRSVAEAVMRETSRHGAGSSPTEPTPRVIFVYAEPALFHHLNAVQYAGAEQTLVLPAGSLQFEATPPGTAAFLAAGLHAGQTPQFLQQIEELGERLEPVGEFEYTASDLVLSDHFSPDQWDQRRRQTVSLFRIR